MRTKADFKKNSAVTAIGRKLSVSSGSCRTLANLKLSWQNFLMGIGKPLTNR
jgi:hypothetical protein